MRETTVGKSRDYARHKGATAQPCLPRSNTSGSAEAGETNQLRGAVAHAFKQHSLSTSNSHLSTHHETKPQNPPSANKQIRNQQWQAPTPSPPSSSSSSPSSVPSPNPPTLSAQLLTYNHASPTPRRLPHRRLRRRSPHKHLPYSSRVNFPSPLLHHPSHPIHHTTTYRCARTASSRAISMRFISSTFISSDAINLRLGRWCRRGRRAFIVIMCRGGGRLVMGLLRRRGGDEGGWGGRIGGGRGGGGDEWGGRWDGNGNDDAENRALRHGLRDGCSEAARICCGTSGFVHWNFLRYE